VHRLKWFVLAGFAVGLIGALVGSCDREPAGAVDAAVSDAGPRSDGGLPSNANLHIIALDDDSEQPVPARVDFAADGQPNALTFSNDTAGVPLGRDTAGLWTSMALLTGDGEARVTPGRYDITVQRATSYSMPRCTVMS